MGKKIVTFGEIMLRLTPPDNLRIQQSRNFLANYGGSEANVAISIANYGGDVDYVTCLPKNALGENCIIELRSHNVGTRNILLGGRRLGTYYMEKAVSMRGSQVIYDRDGSSFTDLQPGMIDWRKIFQDASIFHWSGIDASLTPGLAAVCEEAIHVADEMGLTICCDINYRKNLWNYGKNPKEVMIPLMKHCDIVFGSESEYATVMGIPAPKFAAVSDKEVVNKEAYENYCRQIAAELPRCKYVYIVLRNVMSSEHHTLAGVLYSENKIKTTRVYDITNIIDCIGVGDAFVGGLLYAHTVYDDDRKKLEFATAASVLKNTIAGDYNMIKATEVENLIEKEATGEVDR